jgi:colanic acid/amylovoran biosynthesis glycosyltransferase
MTAPPHSPVQTRHFPIAYIAGQFPLRSETFVWREVRELRRRGWTVHTFGLYAPDEETPAELRDLRESTQVVYSGPRGDRWRGMLGHPIAALRAAFDSVLPSEPLSARGRAKLVVQASVGAELGQHLRQLGVRHIHAHFAHAPTSVAMYAARAAGIPFSFTGHANDLFQRRQLLRKKLRRAAFVSCISQWHRDLYRVMVDRADESYPVIRCGVDIDSFEPTAPTAVHTRPHVVAVCRLVEKKGIDLLLRAVARLRQFRTDLDVTIAGDGPLRSKLEAMSRELSLGERVKFLGAIDASDVRKLLETADLLALPCRVDSRGDRDGIPVVLMEAMACGLPVISGDLPAIRELVRDGENGFLVKPDDVDALASALSELSADLPRARQMGQAGRRHVVDVFSLGQSINLLEKQFLACHREKR